jgi:hypothetical protein
MSSTRRVNSLSVANASSRRLRSRIVFCEFSESFQKFGSAVCSSTFSNSTFNLGESKILL